MLTENPANSPRSMLGIVLFAIAAVCVLFVFLDVVRIVHYLYDERVEAVRLTATYEAATQQTLTPEIDCRTHPKLYADCKMALYLNERNESVSFWNTALCSLVLAIAVVCFIGGTVVSLRNGKPPTMAPPLS
ncbi:MAG: hypothetical protein AAF662_06835 [Pseudomonadota bacterium]